MPVSVPGNPLHPPRQWDASNLHPPNQWNPSGPWAPVGDGENDDDAPHLRGGTARELRAAEEAAEAAAAHRMLKENFFPSGESGATEHSTHPASPVTDAEPEDTHEVAEAAEVAEEGPQEPEDPAEDIPPLKAEWELKQEWEEDEEEAAAEEDRCEADEEAEEAEVAAEEEDEDAKEPEQALRDVPFLKCTKLKSCKCPECLQKCTGLKSCICPECHAGRIARAPWSHCKNAMNAWQKKMKNEVWRHCALASG